MPTLPTLTVSQAHFDRLVNAFPGTTLAEKDAAYKAWLTNLLIDYVMNKELQTLEIAFQTQRRAAEVDLLEQRRLKELSVIASLPPRV